MMYVGGLVLTLLLYLWGRAFNIPDGTYAAASFFAGLFYAIAFWVLQPGL